MSSGGTAEVTDLQMVKRSSCRHHSCSWISCGDAVSVVRCVFDKTSFTDNRWKWTHWWRMYSNGIMSYPDRNIHVLLLWDVGSTSQAVKVMLGVYCGRGTPPLVWLRFICWMLVSGLGDSGTSLLWRTGTEHSSGRGWFASRLCPVVVRCEETCGWKVQLKTCIFGIFGAV